MNRTGRTIVRRRPDRGAYDRDTIYGILDDGFVCHVGFVADGQPYVLPMNYARSGDTLYLHGSPLSRMLTHIAQGVPLCVTVTHVDGLVLARSASNHSLNYRSVVILGAGRRVSGIQEETEALRLLVEQAIPGRSSEVRAPNAKELEATLVVAVPLDEASAKIRSGPPKDSPADMDLGVWAGVVPLSLQAQEPVADPQLVAETPVPAYVRNRLRAPAGFPD